VQKRRQIQKGHKEHWPPHGPHAAREPSPPAVRADRCGERSRGAGTASSDAPAHEYEDMRKGVKNTEQHGAIALAMQCSFIHSFTRERIRNAIRAIPQPPADSYLERDEGDRGGMPERTEQSRRTLSRQNPTPLGNGQCGGNGRVYVGRQALKEIFLHLSRALILQEGTGERA
jgi:hypothetical protein